MTLEDRSWSGGGGCKVWDWHWRLEGGDSVVMMSPKVWWKTQARPVGGA